MEERFEKLNDLLVNFSLGNFDYHIELSENLDDIDTVISGISMLGEELKAVTISKNFFNNIFNAATDMFFVLSDEGIVVNHNYSVLHKTGLQQSDVLGKSICELISCSPVNLKNIIKHLHSSPLLEFETEMYGDNNKLIPVLCAVTNLYPERTEHLNFLLNARDLSKIKEFEESLKSSEEKYRRVFEESRDTIFLAESDGNLKEVNLAGKSLFGLTDQLDGISILDLFIYVDDKKLFMESLRKDGFLHNMPCKMMDQDERILETTISANIIQPGGGIQGIIRDITKEKEYEKLLLKTVVDTQEKERQRFAKDLHDSLGQQLSAITFYINTIRQQTNPDSSEVLAVLGKSNEGLNSVITELRNICFNLMPRTLEHRGLYFAIVELCKKIEFDKMLRFDLDIDENLPDIEKTLEITIYRIIQEFINNSLKHGKAKNISIEGHYNRRGRQLSFKMTDDGVGFDTELVSGGMGLTNIKSRLQPYDGEFRYYSVIGQGTTYEIEVPIQL